MKPVLFQFLGINIYGYGTMIAIGICAAIMLLNYKIKNRGYDEDSVLNMIIVSIIIGILGGKALYIITEFKSILKDPTIIKDIGSGFVVYGAIISGSLAVFFYCKKKRWNSLEMFDMLAPAVALAQGFGRIGCFLAGCCYGCATELPIGVEFKNSLFVEPGVVRHPTQIYSSLFDFVLAIILLAYGKKKASDGKVFALYVILYSVGRFLVEFLRDDPRGVVGTLSTSQFISIFTFIVGIIIFNVHKFKNKNLQ